MAYSLTYHFDELPIGDALLSGDAEIAFDRDRDWTMHDVRVKPDRDLRGYPVIDWLYSGKVFDALVKHRSDDIQEAVNAYEIPPLKVERAIASYEYWRR